MSLTKKVFTLVLLVAFVLGITSCSPKTNDAVSHKPATSACLMKTTSRIGSPDRQLAADLVEAQVVYGIKVKEVEIPTNSAITTRLLTALQQGCVLMISSDERLLSPLKSFAYAHPKMLILFVGSTIAKAEQAPNFRWIADDFLASVSLSGFYAAEQSRNLNLLVQSNYFKADQIQAAYMKGVSAYKKASGNSVSVKVEFLNSPQQLTQKLQAMVEPSFVSLFAAKSYWTSVTDYTNLTMVGSDLQFGKTTAKIDPKVIGSVERNTSTQVLRAVSSLLRRDVNSSPRYRKTAALAAGFNELRLLTDALADLADYRLQLIAENR